MVDQLVMKFPRVYEAPKFNTVFTKVNHWTLPLASSFQALFL